MTRVIGIDPGLNGAIAVLQGDHLTIIDMPTMTIERNGKSKRQVSASDLAEIIKRFAPDGVNTTCALCEKVSAMAGQGVTSVFSFGRSFGMIEGILATLHISTTFVPPATWTKGVGRSPGKDASRARAMELFPSYQQLFSRVKDDGRADAALIAYWGQKNYG